MKRDTHAVFALAVLSYMLNKPLTPEEVMGWILLTMAGALFPDLDYWLRKYPLIVHRKTLHNLWSLLLSSALVYRFLGEGWIPWIVGYVTHLALDSMTKVGIDFLLIGKRIRGPFKTGGLVDRAILVLSALTLIYKAFGDVLMGVIT